MGRKIFVSYKYNDNNVKQIDYNYIFSKNTTVRQYVNKLEEIIGKNDIYKGEHDGEDMSMFADDTIWTNLKQKIFDSSITIVLISPNMKESWHLDKEQWIPLEISYSLKNITHNYRTSRTNGLIYVVLPDRYGSYNYYITDEYFGINYNKNVIFDIMQKNLNNKKYGNGGYAITVKWGDFIKNYTKYINEAVKKQETVDNYNICKIL